MRVQVVFDLQTLLLLSGVVTQARMIRCGTRARTAIHEQQTYTTHACTHAAAISLRAAGRRCVGQVDRELRGPSRCVLRARVCVRGRPACAGTFRLAFAAVNGAFIHRR